MRHCTSITMPDGVCGRSQSCGVGKGDFPNHVYGTFTAAKERIVQAGRRRCAATIDNSIESEHPILEADPVCLCTDEQQVPNVKTASELDNYVIPKKRRPSTN